MRQSAAKGSGRLLVKVDGVLAALALRDAASEVEKNRATEAHHDEGVLRSRK